MIRLGLTEKKGAKEGLAKRLGKVLSFNSYIAIILAVLQLFYSILLINQIYDVELFLATLNLLSWIKLILELQKFEVVRKFTIVFIGSI